MRRAKSKPCTDRFRQGFTIVELLIVIVVIGVLAAITIVAYNGIQLRARIATIQSDLEQGAKTVEAYRFGTSAAEQYPADQSTANLRASPGTTLNYQANNGTSPPSYCLTAVNGNLRYWVSNTNTTPTTGTCTGVLATGASCPTGFIVVPGSSTYGTSEFCVAKYEMKIAGQSNGNQAYSAAFVPESRADGTPWVNVTQANAIAESSTVTACSGCHLISEAEWLTIAQNVLGVRSNWSGASVGSGYVFSGHGDAAPGSALASDSNDANGYTGTGNLSGEAAFANGVVGNSQRRTLQLSNGEVIWDISGNVWEWSQGTAASGQPGSSGFNWREWNASLASAGTLSPNPFPAFANSSASSWTGIGQGIGRLYSNNDDTTSRGFVRGGAWIEGGNAGPFALALSFAPSYVGTNVGFRVAR
jgi:prepilin-type N-terminal cleavage/methylation domain-containing protein